MIREGHSPNHNFDTIGMQLLLSQKFKNNTENSNNNDEFKNFSSLLKSQSKDLLKQNHPQAFFDDIDKKAEIY
jgi:hypothetical protein